MSQHCKLVCIPLHHRRQLLSGLLMHWPGLLSDLQVWHRQTTIVQGDTHDQDTNPSGMLTIILAMNSQVCPFSELFTSP